MSAAATQFTIADLERMPDDGMHREILDGELIELPPAKFGHQDTAKRIFVSLIRYEESCPQFAAYQEGGYRLFRDLSNWLQPDVSVVSTERVRDTARHGYIQGAPEVAIEIISQSESASDVQDKTRAYLRAGSKAVVNIFPKSRTITVHVPDGSARTLEGKDVLTLPDVLPGWEMSLDEIFGE